MIPRETFGDLLRRYRLAAGLTQEELAEKAQVSPRAISDLERGARNRPYRETVQLLATALHLEDAERGQLEAAARRGSPAAPGVVEGSTWPEAGTPRHNLPVQVTSFVGRERELAEVHRFLADTHLLTLTGTGGCGKTRLGLQAAGELMEAYPDGVWLVELAPLADPTLVPGAVAAALGVREAPDRPLLATLGDFLRRRTLLLVLDNCEHVLDAGAQLVDALLRASPSVRILATSREALRVAGEVVFRVPSLAAPRAGTSPAPMDLTQFDAVRLFVERASAVRASFALTATNAAAVAEICRRLDGIPLALELAAARTRALTVEQIAGRLDQRFRLLTGGSRAALPRQQTLAALIGWSYDLLTEPERTLFNRLAVFAGGFDLEAAEWVGGEPPLATEDVLDCLSSLVEKSLVVVGDGVGQEERYWLLETLRQYGWEQLVATGELERVRDRHRDWCGAVAARVAPQLHGGKEGANLKRLVDEHDNLRAALAWCLERDADLGLQICVNLTFFWELQGHEAEGRRWLEAMLARATREPLLRVNALTQLALSLRDQGDFATATSRATEGLALAQEIGSQTDTSEALILLGTLAAAQGDYAQARTLVDDGLDRARQMNNYLTIHWGLCNLGELTWFMGDYALAQTSFEEELVLAREREDKWAIADATSGLGAVAKSAGDVVRAEELLRESVARFRAFGDKPLVGVALAYLGYLVGSKGDYDEAETLLRESVRLLREVGHRPRLARSFCFAGILTARQGDDAKGTRLIAAAESINTFLRAALAPDERADHDATLATARITLGEETFHQAWAKGQAMTLEQAVADALDEGGA